MSHNEYRDQMTYDATKEEETICEDCGVKNDESFSYYMNRCSDCCYKRDERNREYDKEKAEEDKILVNEYISKIKNLLVEAKEKYGEEEFICDQKEKCSNDLSCIGCYPQEEEDYCGCLGEEGSGVCDDCDCGDEMEELNGVKANPVEPPLMVWDGNIKQSKVVFEMGGEPIKKLTTTMKDWMIEEGWKFVDDEDGNTTAIFE